MEFVPLKLISEKIEVQFDKEPVIKKITGCPDRFVWQGNTLQVADVVSEWHDFSRKGRMVHNMRPEHLATAAKRGSRGVGKIYYRVVTDEGRFFDIYYDRAPRNAENSMGTWVLFREMKPE